MLTDKIITPCGEIVGEERDNCRAFLGVRYATAGRFEKPARVDGWDGVYGATAFGACCPQERTYYDERAQKNPFYYKEFREGLEFEYSEDCLFLNVYAPKDARNCPVVMFIHGGNFARGSASERPFDGEEYCKRGVVFVTVNYRLNVFGFFADGEHVTGNLGLYDQACAVDWIKRNISAFGGDPDNLTLMGQSAGAMSIQSLIYSPLMRGKIKRAIMLSGGGVRRLLLPERKANVKIWKSVMSKSGAGSFEEFKALPAKDVYNAWKQSASLGLQFASAPVYDGELIVEQKGECNVPCIVGRLKKDIFPAELDFMARKLAKILKKEGTDCYIYRFEHDLPGDDRGTFHSADLWYAIGNLGNCWRPFGKKDRETSDKMIDAFTAFIKDGAPAVNGESWRPYSDKKDIYIFR